MTGTDGEVEPFGGDGDVGVRRRALERICARRAAITVAFVLSGMIFVVSLLLVVFADLSAGSTAIAVVDAAITGTLCVAAFLVLRACGRLRRGE